MIIPFFEHGQRAYSRAYMLGWNRRAGTPDPRSPQILLGNPDAFDAWEPWCDYASPQYAGVLAFGKDITVEKAREIFDRVFAGMFPGIGTAQLATLAVLHGRPHVHVHWAVGRMNLLTGRRVDLFSRSADGWRLELLQEAINLEYELPSPKDPDRARNKDVLIRGLTCPPSIRREAFDALGQLTQLATAGWLQLTDTAAVTEVLEEQVQDAVVKPTESGAMLRYGIHDNKGELCEASCELFYNARTQYNRGQWFAKKLGFADYSRDPEFTRAVVARLECEIERKRGINEARLLAARQPLGFSVGVAGAHGVGAATPAVRLDTRSPAGDTALVQDGGTECPDTVAAGAEHSSADNLDQSGGNRGVSINSDVVDSSVAVASASTEGANQHHVKSDPNTNRQSDTCEPMFPIDLSPPLIEVDDGVVIDNRRPEIPHE